MKGKEQMKTAKESSRIIYVHADLSETRIFLQPPPQREARGRARSCGHRALPATLMRTGEPRPFKYKNDQ